MKYFILQYIISFFQGKEISPGQAKFFYVTFFGVLTWLTVSQQQISNRLDHITEKIGEVPGIIESSDSALVRQLYSDAEGYAEKIILAIQSANTDIVSEIDISERRRDQLINQVNARFDGLLHEVEQIKESQERENNYKIRVRKIE